ACAAASVASAAAAATAANPDSRRMVFMAVRSAGLAPGSSARPRTRNFPAVAAVSVPDRRGILLGLQRRAQLDRLARLGKPAGGARHLVDLRCEERRQSVRLGLGAPFPTRDFRQVPAREDAGARDDARIVRGEPAP